MPPLGRDIGSSTAIGRWLDQVRSDPGWVRYDTPVSSYTASTIRHRGAHGARPGEFEIVCRMTNELGERADDRPGPRKQVWMYARTNR